MSSIRRTETDFVRAPNAQGNSIAPTSNPLWLERGIPVLLFVFSVAYLYVFRRYTSLEPDEGIVLEGAQRVLRGEVPYRDFFSFYTPGSYYLVAFLFRVFGDSLAVARTSVAVAGATCSVVTYLLARRVCTRGSSLFAAALATIAGFAYRFLVLHNWYSTVLACLAIYSAVRLLESRKPVWAFATGFLMSLTVLFEQSKGAGLILGLGLGFLTVRAMGRRLLLPRSELLTLAVGFALPLTFTFLYFGAQHSAGIMVQDWLWPLHHYGQANRVAYGSQNWTDQARDLVFHTDSVWLRTVKILIVSTGFIVPVLPVIAVGLFVYWAAQMRRGKDAPAKSSYYVLICASAAGLLVSVLAVRADIIHLMYLAPLWYVVLAWLLDSPELHNRLLVAFRPFLATLVTIAFGTMGFAILLNAIGAHNRFETRRGMIRTAQKDTVIEYVQAHVAPEEEVLVYPYLPLYYYLTGTRSPSRYDYFQPGMNTPEQAQEILASLQSQNVKAVLFEPAFAEKIANSWPGTPLRAIAEDSLAEYIAHNYRVCRTLISPLDWRFEYMVRKDERCP
jgi:4-amino-4-deoxy-L-arabinose transferase-like glycosyltransferase